MTLGNYWNVSIKINNYFIFNKLKLCISVYAYSKLNVKRLLVISNVESKSFPRMRTYTFRVFKIDFKLYIDNSWKNID